jgi:hypothetical protein
MRFDEFGALFAQGRKRFEGEFITFRVPLPPTIPERPSRGANKHINSRNNDAKLKPQWAQREIT